MSDLVERVARAICQDHPMCVCDEMNIACRSKFAHEQAVTAIRVVVEECADMLEQKARTSGMYPAVTLERAANDIRALLEDGE